jgi:IS605 OrfB family transposase
MNFVEEPNTTRTFHTNLETLSTSDEILLQNCATLLSKVERNIFAYYQANKKVTCDKFLTKFGITVRHYNGCNIEIQGLIASNLSNLKNHIAELKIQIKTLEKVIDKIEDQKKPNRFKLHYKKRKLYNKKQKLSKLEEDLKNKKVRVAFGSKKLFQAQHNLKENGYSSKKEWYQDWFQARNKQFFIVGCKSESWGNQNCQLIEKEDQKFDLFLRLPDAFVNNNQSKILHLKDIRFPYGYEAISAAVSINTERQKTKVKDRSKSQGQALSFRFYKNDNQQWKLFVMTDIQKPELISKKDLGRLGIDINENHLAATEMDRFGNLVKTQSFSLVTYGKSSDQTLAIIGDVSKEIIKWAKAVQKPIVLEKLDFKDKKAQLEKTSSKQARQLSSFAYSAIKRIISSRAFREGIEVDYVNPAYTSFIGKAKFQIPYGLTSHQSAALVIGRRSMRLSEKPLKSESIVLTKDTEIYNTLSLPVRKMSRHVWSWWRKFYQQFQSAVVPQHRAKILFRSSSRTKLQNIVVESTRCDEKSSMFLGEIPKRSYQNCSGSDEKLTLPKDFLGKV